mmetsp:Transcript_24099/g.65205  ORF Transcript_24099/g.65205 Transcript_24099/m.65205 type:complete len:201 (-) Transcript_24099:396-998(-)
MAASTTSLMVMCPPGVREGQTIAITHPQTKQVMHVIVPWGVVPGTQFQVQIAAPLPIAQSTPVQSGALGSLPIAQGVPAGVAPPPYSPAAPPVCGQSPQYAGDAHAQSGGLPPDIRVAKNEWFDFFDRDRSNGLDRRELTSALVVTFRAQADGARQASIASAVDSVWAIFDLDRNGVVTRNEFSRPDGLADTIIANLHFA